MRRLREQAGERVAAWYWADRQPLETGAVLELADRGVLRLVVVSQERLYGRIVGLLARLNPWAWRGGNTLYLSRLLVATLIVVLLRGLVQLLGVWMAGRALQHVFFRRVHNQGQRRQSVRDYVDPQ